MTPESALGPASHSVDDPAPNAMPTTGDAPSGGVISSAAAGSAATLNNPAAVAAAPARNEGLMMRSA